jgi:hypothetical protein
MQKANKQFDPSDQFAELLNEIDATLQDTAAKFDRLNWLRKKMAEQFAAAIAASDTIDIYTEAEAAEILKLGSGKQGENALRHLRSKFGLPFLRFGREVRYTREHLREICSLLEMNRKPRKAMQAEPLKRAA